MTIQRRRRFDMEWNKNKKAVGCIPTAFFSGFMILDQRAAVLSATKSAAVLIARTAMLMILLDIGKSKYHRKPVQVNGLFHLNQCYLITIRVRYNRHLAPGGFLQRLCKTDIGSLQTIT